MMPQKAIKVELSAKPWQLTMSSRKNFKISISATNQGGTTIDPELHRAKLFVNGNEAHVTMHVLEGSREEIEKQLKMSLDAFFDFYPEI